MWRDGVRPSITSTLARPMSASSSTTSCPAPANDLPRFTATVLLPTPPLPPATAMVRQCRRAAGAVGAAFSRLLAWWADGTSAAGWPVMADIICFNPEA